MVEYPPVKEDHVRILITGSQGQLGQALQRRLTEHAVLAIDLPEYDITDYQAITKLIASFRPDVIIHAAAYTNVDGCESDPDGAYLVNALGTKYLALGAQSVGARMVYVSTNYVFDGTKDSPYLEYDAPNPISVYGRSKLAGEQIVTSLVEKHYIARTAWLYAEGGRNFVNTVVRLATQTDRLRMVTDEVATPTYAGDLADAIVKLIDIPAYGLYHFSNDGYCSRYELAAEILRLIGNTSLRLDPISLDDWDRPARPPRFSPMRNLAGAHLGITLRPWQDALGDFLCASR